MPMALALAIPCLSMDGSYEQQASQTFKEVFLTKCTITQENFDKAMKPIFNKNNYLAEKLVSKLKKWVNKELTADEWSIEVQKAYREVLSAQQKAVAKVMSMDCPIQDVLVWTMNAIPN